MDLVVLIASSATLQLQAFFFFFLNLRRLTSIMGRWEWGREVAHTSNQPATPDMITPLKFITRKAAL